MMNENIKAFLKKVNADKELQAKFEAVRDPEEAYKLASSIQSGFTKEEFVATMTKIKEASETLGELKDDDLVKVAGGGVIQHKKLCQYYSIFIQSKIQQQQSRSVKVLLSSNKFLE